MKRILMVVLAVILVGVSLLTIFNTKDAISQGRFVRTGRIWNNGNFINKPVTVASAAGSVTLPDGYVIYVTGTGSITRLTASADGLTPGRVVILRHATTDTLVDGVNLKLAGDFAGTADDVLVLCYSITGTDTFWTEISRSVN